MASLLAPLHLMLTSTNKISTWNDILTIALKDVKNKLSSATFLVFLYTSAPITIAVDGSATAVGAVLQQFSNAIWELIAFFSEKLSKAETSYSVFNRELLAF